MAKRPRVFEQQEVAAQLRDLGVPVASVSPTISFMRLIIPLAVQNIGVEGFVNLIDSASTSWGLDKHPAGWRRTMATSVVNWAGAVLEEYRDERFGAQDSEPPVDTGTADRVAAPDRSHE